MRVQSFYLKWTKMLEKPEHLFEFSLRTSQRVESTLVDILLTDDQFRIRN